ncbi:lipocalin-like domain-containing protein [uncultured Bacteroides sp.]|uniref:lipocalin-like domain-containing protein n=1 Tax=uncultured Bacteroides sp. TaxID=162156 RepID=UPI002633288E|nr:lipocalin-like domain-containing protein [uncultured Bacteroides sp.]
MKKILSIWGILLLAILCNSCEKEPINRDIEGHWQLLEFTTKADGEVHPCTRIYYSIQLWVVEVAEKQGPQGLTPFRGRYQYDESNRSIRLSEMSTYATLENSRPAEVWELNPYGLNDVNTTFKVIESDGKQMTLESDYALLKLRKF